MSGPSPLDSPQSGPESPKEIPVQRTYLALSGPDALRPAAEADIIARLEPLADCPVATWRDRYRQIGGPWHWHDRDAWSDERLAGRLARDDVRIFEVAVRTHEGRWDRPMGFVELERLADGSVEIVYLGLDQAAMGRGLGGWLVTEAARAAFAVGDGRVVLNTCTLDAAAALPNYLARGFTIVRTETYTARI